jgi:hypothetical protein
MRRRRRETGGDLRRPSSDRRRRPLAESTRTRSVDSLERGCFGYGQELGRDRPVDPFSGEDASVAGGHHKEVVSVCLEMKRCAPIRGADAMDARIQLQTDVFSREKGGYDISVNRHFAKNIRAAEDGVLVDHHDFSCPRWVREGPRRVRGATGQKESDGQDAGESALHDLARVGSKMDLS